MLTENQINKFEKLISNIENPNYKKLVTEAVENWKQSKYKPMTGYFGFGVNSDMMCEESGAGSCLLGAFCLNKMAYDNKFPHEELLTPNETHVVLNVFDKGSYFNTSLNLEEYSELVTLVLNIRHILNLDG